MANLKNVWLILATASAADSGSGSGLELQLITSGKDEELNITSAVQKGLKTKLNSVASWRWSKNLDHLALDSVKNVDLEILGDDLLVLSWIFVILEDTEGNRTMHAHTTTTKLSTDHKEGEKSVEF